MKKGVVQAIMLALLFAVSLAVGYFAPKLIPAGKEVLVEDEAQVLEAEETGISVIPEILGIEGLEHDMSGMYRFSVKATVPSGDGVIYILYSDESRSMEIGRCEDGKFSGISPSVSKGVYWLCAVNKRTMTDSSALTPVSGFNYVAMVEKITKSELENICNSGDFGNSTSSKFSNRVSKSLVLVPNGMRANEREVKKIDDICKKINMETWKNIKITGIEYDKQNKLSKVVFDVIY